MTTQAAYIRLAPDVLDGLRRDRTRLERVVNGQLNVGKRVELADALDGLHYLLSPRRRAGATGDSGDSFGRALFGVESANAYVLDEAEQVRFVDAGGVARIDAELQEVGGGDLSRVFDAAAMDAAGVAPGGWVGRGDAGFESLLDAFLQWRELYHRAAEENQAVLCVYR